MPFEVPHLRLIDFGSALDPETIATMYGPDGPSAAEQTPEYAPPEAVFASRWPGVRTVRRHLNPSPSPTPIPLPEPWSYPRLDGTHYPSPNPNLSLSLDQDQNTSVEPCLALERRQARRQLCS